MAAELEDRCPICLGSWEDASFVMPCLHRFCYSCILRWAESKPECPLCKRGIVSILHSVRADDDYREHIITPSVTPSVIVRQAGGAPRHPAAHNFHRPGAPQQRAAERVPRYPVGGFQLPNWMNSFQNHPTLFQTLQSWVHQELEELFGDRVLEAATVEDPVTSTLTNNGMDTEVPGRMLGVSLQSRMVTFMQHRARVAVRQRNREARRLLGQQDDPAVGGQEGSPAVVPCPAASQGGFPTPGPAPSSSPAATSMDELPSTSSAAIGGGPSRHPSAPAAIPMEQEETQEEPGEAVPGPSTSIQGTERSSQGPRRRPKRKTGTSEDSPATKRPAPRR